MGDPGRLIAFEGVEGAGKSTQLELLRAALEDRSREVVVTREPGGTPTGERGRALLLDPEVELHPRAEALLFAAARAELVERVIRPALERGAVVLCDRYLDSSLAYQGGARGLGRGPVQHVNRAAARRGRRPRRERGHGPALPPPGPRGLPRPGRRRPRALHGHRCRRPRPRGRRPGPGGRPSPADGGVRETPRGCPGGSGGVRGTPG